jgi:ABC-type sugar transport system ATPase subunit
MGIIFITHRLHTLRSICDRIYLLENGVLPNPEHMTNSYKMPISTAIVGVPYEN